MRMKKLLPIVLLALIPMIACAQREVTKFLGIPVDGTKTEMIQKLKAKGFTQNPYNKDVLDGEFNGTDVSVWVVTNNNKVYRIMVVDANYRNVTDIKIRFNTLCHQFENNSKYISLGNYLLSDSEDISYEMTVSNKRYEAVYCQKGSSEEDNIYEKASMRHVWFMISNYGYDQYGICLYYDNEYNRANGEDL